MRQTGIIYITAKAPAKLTDELMLAGFRVWEALAESEAKYLCETEDIDALVIAHDVPWRKRITTLKLALDHEQLASICHPTLMPHFS